MQLLLFLAAALGHIFFQIKIFYGAVKITYGAGVIMIDFTFDAKCISRHIKTCKAQCNMAAINPPVLL